MSKSTIRSLSRLVLATVLVAGGLLLLAPEKATSIYWGEGEWVATSYSLSTPNTCDAALGEVCKEWCFQDGGSLVASGDLCCVSGTTCQAVNYRPQ